jgi:hypothetical protein
MNEKKAGHACCSDAHGRRVQELPPVGLDEVDA